MSRRAPCPDHLSDGGRANPVLTGVLSGLQTQPAVLSFATQQAGSQVPDVGYATVYPLAMVSKILLAQAIVLLL